MTFSKMCRLTTAVALSFTFAAVALCQRPVTSTWEGLRAQLANNKQTLFVVTVAHPKNRHKCLIESISSTGDSGIVCNQHGHKTIYKSEDVAALILPGVHTRWYLYGLGFLAASGAATWGTVVLSSVCAPCAVATGVAAFLLFWMAPASAFLTDGDSSDTLLYLAAGQTLKVKLG